MHNVYDTLMSNVLCKSLGSTYIQNLVNVIFYLSRFVYQSTEIPDYDLDNCATPLQ